jgi:hypothetical protein
MHPRLGIPPDRHSLEAGNPSAIVIPSKRGIHRQSSFPRKRESMLSISECDDSRKMVGNRWIPAFAGMTSLEELSRE